MISKFILILILSFGLIMLGTTVAFAFHGPKKITPYGDYCSRMSHYGTRKSVIDLKHAEEMIRHYYGGKGLNIEIIDSQGRFLKVKIKDGNSVIDTIIFDRRTGRVRSVF